MDGARVNHFKNPHATRYQGYDGTTVENLLDGWITTDVPHQPGDNYELIAFRVAMAYENDAETWRVSHPMRECDAVELESQLRATLGDFIQTQLRPVWGRLPSQQTYGPPKPAELRIARDAYEATKYFLWCAKNNMKAIMLGNELANTYLEKVACVDYVVYENMCRLRGIKPIPCKSPYHDDRLHG